MYACIHQYQMNGSPIADPVDASWRLGDTLSRTPGFVATIAVQGHSGALFTITVFEDQISLISALSLCADWSPEHRSMLEPRATEVAIGEVVAQCGL